ncbi:MAG: DEAD/DEAH box helicase [Desulfatirhabdiaceae bacterium]
MADMTPPASVTEYIEALKASSRMGHQVIFHQIRPSLPPVYQHLKHEFPDSIQNLLNLAGMPDLYSHQADAIDAIRSGHHVVVATPTASGKSLIYHLPMLEQVQNDPTSTALYLFPLKALAQDQLRTIDELTTLSDSINCKTAIYDGDVSTWNRQKIRRNPPHILLTNPEMLHLSILAHHQQWSGFLQHLKLVVVDEVHTYRGLLGSHMAWVFRRLNRICRHYGASPLFVCCSATVDNPAELGSQLTGFSLTPVLKNGAPQGKKHVVFINPSDGPAQTTILLLKAALHRKLRTIVYTQSRDMTELIAMWASRQSGINRDRISAYRAGFLPEERRSIESRMASGELLAVISTSALELGIDIGNLDICILVGYPGTVVSTWQRAGRVGRGGQDSALILIAGENALDQYFMRNPKDLLDRRPEAAVANPLNPAILERHLVCAADEIPLKSRESMLSDDLIQSVLRLLEIDGRLLKSHDGAELVSSRKNPQRQVDLRGSGQQFVITDSGKTIGDVDGFRAFRETHPGAVYLHRGGSYVVDSLDVDACQVFVSPKQVNYYTRVRGTKETEILKISQKSPVWQTCACLGRLQVTDQVTGYDKWRIHPHQKLGIIPLDLPAQRFETEGFWIEIPETVRQKTETAMHHFMGGIHAIEHAAIGMFPLLVMTDRNDMGGISTPFHDQVGGAAVFVYDAIPGGAGLSAQAFSRISDLLNYTLKVIESCPCENGCPSCVHSPKCGSGNRPIDKAAALFILKQLKGNGPVAGIREKMEKWPDFTGTAIGSDAMLPADNHKSPKPDSPMAYGVLDIETQRSAQEVGGWNRADRMGVSCAVLYDSRSDQYLEFLEHQIDDMIDHLFTLDRIVGFNIKRFDYEVLRGYSGRNIRQLNTLDILEVVHGFLGYRLSLDHLAKVTLGAEKSGDGLQALVWWKEGRIREIVDYCKMDVKLTRDLYLFGRQNRYLLFQNKAKKTVRLPVSFD